MNLTNFQKNCLIFILVSVFCQCTDNRGNYFDRFQKIEKDTLHVFASLFYKNDSLMKIHSISKKNINLFKQHLGSRVSDENWKIYILGKIEINTEFEGLLVNLADQNVNKEETFLYVLDLNKKLFTQWIKIAELYTFEGTEGEMDSWIFDYNKDNYPDILSRYYYYRFIQLDDDHVEREENEKNELMIWNENGYFEKIIITADKEWIQQFDLQYLKTN